MLRISGFCSVDWMRHELASRPILVISAHVTLEQTARASASVPQSAPGGLPSPAPELSVVVPTFNERDNIPRLIDLLKTALAQIAWELIVVDDNSPDGTAELTKRMAATDARIRCIRRIGRRGLA